MIIYGVHNVVSITGYRVRIRCPTLLFSLFKCVDAVLTFNLRCKGVIVLCIVKPSAEGIVGYGNDLISFSAVRAFIICIIS